MSIYVKDSIITGCVTGIEKYGIFIGLDEFHTGLIHISEVSKSFVKDINDYVAVGETIKAKVLEIDSNNNQIKLSIKDIDYRITKRKRKRIVETENAFSTLNRKRDEWISEKLIELGEKNQ